MLTKIFENVAVSGIACALPTRRVFTDEYIKHFGEDGIRKFKDATGIESRYLSNGKQTAGDLCYVAARELMRHKNLSGDDIDAVVFFTQSGDYKTPSTAFILHKRLNLKEDCLVFDVNLGCSGFVNGVCILSSMIKSGAINRALLLVGDANLEHPVYNDKSFTMMFGEAGGACILEHGDSVIKSVIMSDGSGYKALLRPVPGDRFPNGYPNISEDGLSKHMHGDDVFIFTITKVPKMFKEFFSENNCSINDYDYCVLHQANLMILKTLAKKLKIPAEKMPISLDRYGNTNGASVPLGIVDLCGREGVQENLHLITSGFGIGLSWGLADFKINKADVLAPIFTDEYFEEGFEV